MELAERPARSVFRTEAQNITLGYIMNSRGGLSIAFLFSAILVIFLFLGTFYLKHAFLNEWLKL